MFTPAPGFRPRPRRVAARLVASLVATLLLSGLILALDPATLAPLGVEVQDTGERKAAGDAPLFSTPAFTLGDVECPIAACFDDAGNLYVLESWSSRVRLFTAASRSPLRSFGRIGSRPAEFRDPADLAHFEGTLVVADTGNHRVQAFTSDGGFQFEVESAADPLITPHGVDIAADTIAVADTGNHRVVIYDGSGRPRRTVGQHGSGLGQLIAPSDVAIDSRGHLWVTDAGNHRVVEFDPDGKPVRSVGARGAPPGFFDRPTSIEVFRDHVYVVDSRNHRIQVLGLDGGVVGSWGIHSIRPHDGDGHLHYPTSIAFDPRVDLDPPGRLAVVCEPFEDRIQGFSNVPDPDRPPPRGLPGNPPSDTHFSTRLSWRGSLAAFITEGETAIAVYDVRPQAPVRIHDFGRYGTNPGELLAPTDLELGTDRRIYVCDPLARRLAIYEHDWDREGKTRYRPAMTRWVRSLDTALLQQSTRALADLPVLEFDLIEVDPGGELYLMDTRLGIVVVLDQELKFQRRFGGIGSKPGLFQGPSDLAFDAKGNRLLIVDTGNARVQVLRPDGSFLHSIGRRGSGRGEFIRPFGVAITDDDSIFVTDMATHRIQQLRRQGRYLDGWGAGKASTTPADRLDRTLVYKPAGIAVSLLGKDVLTVDWGHHRAQLRVGERVIEKRTPDGKEPRMAPMEYRVFGARAYLPRPARTPDRPGKSGQGTG